MLFTLKSGKIESDFEKRYLGEDHREYEAAVLLFIGFITMVAEPVFYLLSISRYH
jgi:hypothetical protein